MKSPKILIVLLLFFMMAGCDFSNNYKIFVIFDNVEGLKESSEVFGNGLEIGEIEDMKLVREGVLVTLTIKNKYKITTNSDFKIADSGFLSKRIEITQGNATSFIKELDTIKGLRNNDRGNLEITSEKLDTLMTTFVKAIEHSQNKQKQKKTISN